ncbi:MAG TPA: lipopolysaccharide biosynthesis protein [Candidatus Acidoferrum sp.]|nr:lipopolysaccharide biosynthesis protein [Candidatus Acidoferrum sp.]
MKASTSNVPHKNLAASIGRNTLFGVLSNFAQVGTRLVTVPIVIHHLGLGGYGIWNIIMTTATYMRFGSVGVKTAFQKYVAEATGDGDYERASKLLSTGFAVMLLLSVAGLIPVAIFATNIAHAAGVPPEFLASAAGAISLLAWIMVMANVGATFEAIVMGGHRIDLVRKFGTALTVAEAVSIVIVLRLGFGLFAMAAVMGISELCYITACYFVSRKVVPEIRLRFAHVSSSVLYELVRFAGSYQLVNLLEVLYGSILPFGILRAFGAESAGVYAVVTRVVTSAAVLLDAFLPPILSGGTMVYASGATQKLQTLLVKAFKVTLALSLFPLGFIAVFGSTMAYAWTGENHTSFRLAFVLVCLTAFFRAFSLLALVLYRISGKALLDNIRQVLRIAIILAVVAFAHQLGFFGVLTGLAIAELAGMIFMLFALAHTFLHFRINALVPDTLRMTAAATLIIGAGVLASFIPLPAAVAGQSLAVSKLVVVGAACLLVAWPSLTKTGSLDPAESRALLGTVLRRPRAVPSDLPATEQS